MNRFFADPENIGDSRIYITDKNDVKHISKVLRLELGDIVEVSDGSKWEYTGYIEAIDDEVAIIITDKQKFSSEPNISVDLFQGVPKGQKMELIVQKCVELGINRIIPVFMKRTVVKDNGKFFKKTERWQKISDEACKQCKRGVIPEVDEKHSFMEMKNSLREYDLVILPYENEDDFSIKDCLRQLPEKPEKIAMIIGPEGGFAEKEVEELVSEGAIRVTLGKTVLRTETAGMAALAMIMYELEL